MKNMKVQKKLVLSFLIIAVITAIVGVIAVVGLLMLNSNQNEMYVYSVNSNSANHLIDNIERQRIAYRDAILYKDDDEKRDAALAQLSALDTGYQELYTYLRENLQTEKAQELLTVINNAYEEYLPLRSLMLAAIPFDDGVNLYRRMDSLVDPIRTIIVSSNELVDYATVLTGDMSEQDQKVAFTLIFIVSVSAFLSVSAGILLGLYTARNITIPLVRMKEVMDRVGHTGSLEFSAEEIHGLEEEARYKDEIGQTIASSLKMVRHLEKASGVLKQVADGDLTASFESLSENDTLGISLNQMLDNLNSMFRDIHVSSLQVSSGAAQVSQGAQELAAGSSQQAASIEEFNATLEDLRTKTDRNAANTMKAREANGRAAERLSGSIQSMGELLKAMKAIDESSGSITKIIKVIDDIAFQTNILALNAAVEAARAGQHGKGFAVVADEVRNLAAKSAEAAKETAGLIEDSSVRVKEGNQIVARTNSDLEAAAENSRDITQLIEQVATESGEQAKSIAEITQGIEQISIVVQSNSATSEQSAAASEEMSAQAAALEDIVGKFTLKPSEVENAGHTGISEVSRESGFAISGSGNKYGKLSA